MPRAKRTRHDPIPNSDLIVAQALSEMASLPAAYVPAYNAADLPLASENQNCFVNILDNPQGLASTALGPDGWYWRSEVDGMVMGPGNARASS